MILVIDDSELNLQLIKLILNNHHYEVCVAKDANEALNMLSSIHPELILMDVQLPEVNGYELVALLKANSSYRDIPVVMMSAYVKEEDERKAMDAGCSGYIKKPLNIYTLVDQLKKFIK